jgi:maleylacetoacetate isomerase
MLQPGNRISVMKLYEYFRSSASYRVRIALNLKGIAAGLEHIKLTEGAQRAEPYLRLNPHGRVPALELDTGTIITQSPAILEYLEEAHPNPPFLPTDPVARAKIREMAALIACDIHPLNNLGVLSYLRETFHQDKEAVNAWYAHWITEGFRALEQMVQTPYCAGATLSLADIYLVPQCANAHRMNVSLAPFPKIRAIEAACLALPAFQAARPENHPAAPPS